MAYPTMNTLDTLDLMGVEVQLGFALDELKDAFGSDPDAGTLIHWICDTVSQVENRVIQSPADVQANVAALNRVREALEKLGQSGKEAGKALDSYLAYWSHQ